MKNIEIKIERQPGRDGASRSYLLVYDFNGVRIVYYPADIDTIKADIEIELEQCVARANHEVCISGYPVMTADFDGNYVKFAETEEDVKQGNLIARIEADEFVAALHLSMEQAVHLYGA